MSEALSSAAALFLLAGLSAAAAAPLSPPDEASAERAERMCKMTVQGQTPKAREDYVQSCVAQTSPTFSYWEHCRQSAQKQHLKGLALRDDVNACMDRIP